MRDNTLRFAGVTGDGRLSSVADVGAAYDGGLSPVEIVEQCLARIAAQNDALRAMIAVDSDGARAAARQAEAELRAGRRRSALHGIPIAIKDMLDVAGWPTTAGSSLFERHPARADAVCVANLRAAGAIILGKTNLHELATGGHDNPWFGKVVNPLDGARGTGGSSSGSACAVAAGFCVAAIGTDTGGSNRSPAAATGLVGFKPTQALIDRTGVLPTARSLDAVGAFTSTVADGRLMAAVLSGGAAPSAIPLQATEIVVAKCPDLYAAAAVDPAVIDRHEVWFDALRRAGIRVVELPFDDGASLRDAAATILKFEFAEYYGRHIDAHPDRVGDGARKFAESARLVAPEDYARAIARRDETKRRFVARMAGIDVVAIPTVPGLAPRLSDELTMVGDAMVPYGAAGVYFRLWANYLDMPALALPLFREKALPASIQIAARPGRDWVLFDIAAALTNLGA